MLNRSFFYETEVFFNRNLFYEVEIIYSVEIHFFQLKFESLNLSLIY